MNNKFKILWFEDEVSWYRMELIQIEDILTRYCLVPEITRKDGSDFSISELVGNDFDLILMDFKLAEGKTGDSIVSAIRENDILTDILFYSSEEKSMLAAIYASMPTIDGVYLAKRDYEIFTKKIGKLISKIVKRSEDLVNLRGFVMDESSDFEVRILEILNIVWQKFNQLEKNLLEEAVKKNISRNQKRDEKNKNNVLGENPTFPAAVNNIYFFNHSDRLYLFEKTIDILLENYGLKFEPEYKSFKATYEENISHYRNALGHRKSTENTIELTKGNYIQIDESLHQVMRTNLTRYNEIIKYLESFVTQQI